MKKAYKNKKKKGDDSDEDMGRRASIENSFLFQYAEGDLLIFEEMIDKMISSKNYEIYNQAKIRKNDPNALPETSDEDSNSEKEGSESSDSEEDSDGHLRPSGIIF